MKTEKKTAFGVLLALGFSILSLQSASAQLLGQGYTDTCDAIGITDGCTIIAESAKMLAPSYQSDKTGSAIRSFAALGFNAQYFPVRNGLFQPTIDVFLVARPKSNRLYIVITGTESTRDWLENSKFGAYTAKYEDGQFYTPPGHAGFHRGILSIINSGLFKINEFDDMPLDCANQKAGSSGMARFLCTADVADGSGQPIQTIITGHSRGSAIAQLLGPVVDGFEFRRVAEQKMSIERQNKWPLRLQAIIGFAPPYSIYARTDRDAGVKVPDGILDHWDFYAAQGYAAKTVLFVNDRDVVPSVSLGQGRHIGHRYRTTGYGATLYDGQCWGPDASTAMAHSSAGYADAVLNPKPQQETC